MSTVRTHDGLTVHDAHDLKPGSGLTISESLEVIALELSLLRVLLHEVAENRGELNR